MKKYTILAVLILGLAFTAAYPGAVQFDFLLSQARYSAGSLAGAKVWIYKAGTTTIDNDVWLDIHKAQRAANPYTLDANGTALLYGDNTYRVVIRSQPDNVVRIDRDNVYVGDGWTDFVDSNYTTTIRPKNVYGDGSGTVSGYKFGSPAFTDNGSFHDLQGNGGILDQYTITGSIINGSQLVDNSVLLAKLGLVDNSISGGRIQDNTIAVEKITASGTPDNTTFLRGDGAWSSISDNGTFTATLSGCTTSPTGTVNYARVGNIVALAIPTISGTSNSAGAALSGLPAALVPSVTQDVIVIVQDNSVAKIAHAGVRSNGSIELLSDVAAGAFISSGTKGIYIGTITYMLP